MPEREDGNLQRELGISRRDLVRRGAVVGGTLMWAAPVIQSLAPPAFASHDTGPSPATHFCCYCSDPIMPRPPGKPTTDDFCAGLDGGFFTDGHPGTDAHCRDHCADAAYNSHQFQSGPNDFTCNTNPASGPLGCAAP
jgi:hypothetical protein